MPCIVTHLQALLVYDNYIVSDMWLIIYLLTDKEFNGEPTQLIHQVALLHNSDLLPSTASVPLPHATFIIFRSL